MIATYQALYLRHLQPLFMQHEFLEAEQKALEINLDNSLYGTFAEIGAGQEVARYFFKQEQQQAPSLRPCPLTTRHILMRSMVQSQAAVMSASPGYTKCWIMNFHF